MTPAPPVTTTVTAHSSDAGGSMKRDILSRGAGEARAARLPSRAGGDSVLPMAKKKFETILRRLNRVPELSEHERILFARSLAATPDERWKMHEQFLRSHGLFTRSERKAFGFK